MNITEEVFNAEHLKGSHGIFEMSRISHKLDNLPKNTAIYVYGEADETGHKPPHFHVKVDGKFEFEIQFTHFHDLEIWRSKTVKHDWKQYAERGWRPYSDVKKAIKKWLEKDNVETPMLSNIRVILHEWNRQNENSEIDVETFLKLYDKLK